ncbi:MAG: porin [Verrucomicrobiales bacterium]|jgi:hypothetical protein|nr:porin [Verrucomicrobiales bacterium]
MNKLIAGLFGAALMTGAAFADAGAPTPSAKDLSKAVEKVNYVETDVAGVRLNGYVDVGYLYNFYVGDNLLRHGSDAASGGNFNLNVVKLTVDKPLSNKNEWSAGFRADLMFGQDAGHFNDAWLPGSASEFFLEQGYITARAPIGNGLDIKAGKFAAWLGYEATDRPANLNITYGDIYGLLPATLTGVAVEYPINNSFSVGLAVGNGANLDFNDGTVLNGSVDHHDGYGIMAKLDYTVPGGNASWNNNVYYSWDAAGERDYSFTLLGDSFWSTQSKNSLVIYDGVLNWVPKFTNGKLLLGANYDLGNWAGVDHSTTFAAGALYAKYQFTDVFSLAGRGTYVHANHATGAGESVDLWSVTLTAGFNVVENLVIRAEYRFDLGNDRIQDGPTILHDSGHTVAVQAVYTF